MSKEKTEDEVRDEFIAHVRMLVDYWSNVKERDCKGKLDGLAFSILAAIDGESADVPGYILAPLTHEDDKQFHIDNRTDYYPENDYSNIKCDISGDLHNQFYKTK